MIIKRVIYIVSCMIYLLAYFLAYHKVAAGSYNYVGFGYGNFGFESYIFISFLSIIPSFFMPLKSYRASVYIYSIFYFLIYIPMLVVSNDPDVTFNIDSESFSITLFICFMMLVCSSRLTLFKSCNVIVRNELLAPINVVIMLSFPIALIVVFKLINNFSLISIFNVYDKRDSLKELDLGFLGYLIPWLTNFILPVIIAHSILNKKKVIVVSCVMIYIFLYFTMGSKMFLLSGLYFILGLGYLKSISRYNLFLPSVFSVLLLIPFIIIGDSALTKDVRMLFEGLVIVRTFLIQGLSAPVYVEFFDENYITYFSHISVFREFIDYPYTSVIPVELSKRYGLGNYNAPFFVSDGYASLKFLGMYIITMFVCLFFYLLDLFSKDKNHSFTILSLSVFIVSIANVSFASAIITFGGLLFLIFNLFTYKPMED